MPTPKPKTLKQSCNHQRLFHATASTSAETGTDSENDLSGYLADVEDNSGYDSDSSYMSSDTRPEVVVIDTTSLMERQQDFDDDTPGGFKASR